GGEVDGNVTERHAGRVIVRGPVDGNVDEHGSGHVYLHSTAEVDGNVTERKAGNVYRYRTADIDGSVRETCKGRLVRRSPVRVTGPLPTPGRARSRPPPRGRRARRASLAERLDRLVLHDADRAVLEAEVGVGRDGGEERDDVVRGAFVGDVRADHEVPVVLGRVDEHGPGAACAGVQQPPAGDPVGRAAHVRPQVVRDVPREA